MTNRLCGFTTEPLKTQTGSQRRSSFPILFSSVWYCVAHNSYLIKIMQLALYTFIWEMFPHFLLLYILLSLYYCRYKKASIEWLSTIYQLVDYIYGHWLQIQPVFRKGQRSQMPHIEQCGQCPTGMKICHQTNAKTSHLINWTSLKVFQDGN